MQQEFAIENIPLKWLVDESRNRKTHHKVGWRSIGSALEKHESWPLSTIFSGRFFYILWIMRHDQADVFFITTWMTSEHFVDGPAHWNPVFYYSLFSVRFFFCFFFYLFFFLFCIQMHLAKCLISIENMQNSP